MRSETGFAGLDQICDVCGAVGRQDALVLKFDSSSPEQGYCIPVILGEVTEQVHLDVSGLYCPTCFGNWAEDRAVRQYLARLEDFIVYRNQLKERLGLV